MYDIEYMDLFYEEVDNAVEKGKLTLENASDVITNFNSRLYEEYLETVNDKLKNVASAHINKIKEKAKRMSALEKDIDKLISQMTKWIQKKVTYDHGEDVEKRLTGVLNLIEARIKEYIEIDAAVTAKDFTELNKQRAAKLKSWAALLKKQSRSDYVSMNTIKSVDKASENIKGNIRNISNKKGSKYNTDPAIDKAVEKSQKVREKFVVGDIDKIKEAVAGISLLAGTAGVLMGNPELAVTGAVGTMGATIGAEAAVGKVTNFLQKIQEKLKNRKADLNRDLSAGQKIKYGVREKIEKIANMPSSEEKKATKQKAKEGSKPSRSKLKGVAAKVAKRLSAAKTVKESGEDVYEQLQNLKVAVYEAFDIDLIDKETRDTFLEYLNIDNYVTSEV